MGCSLCEKKRTDGLERKHERIRSSVRYQPVSHASVIEEPTDEAYRQLIRSLLSNSTEFLLVVRGDMKLRPEGKGVLDQLAHLLLRREEGRTWPGGGIGGTKHTAILHYFRSDPAAFSVLGEAVRRLYEWKQPLRPEDLSFWTSKTQVLFGLVAHDKMAWLEGDMAAIERIRADIGNRFLGPTLEA
jgi:hypothetical protein